VGKQQNRKQNEGGFNADRETGWENRWCPRFLPLPPRSMHDRPTTTASHFPRLSRSWEMSWTGCRTWLPSRECAGARVLIAVAASVVVNGGRSIRKICDFALASGNLEEFEWTAGVGVPKAKAQFQFGVSKLFPLNNRLLTCTSVRLIVTGRGGVRPRQGEWTLDVLSRSRTSRKGRN
jgi:hypothetical protein